MKRQTTRLALFAAILAPVFLAGCNKPMDLGTWVGNTYSNNYFRFVINAPTAWEPASRQVIRKLSRLGADMVGAKDKELAKALARGDISSYQLFMYSQHPFGAPVEFNPNMVCSMDRVGHLSRIKTPADFQREMSKTLRRLGIKLDNSATGTVTLGSNEFHRMRGSMSVQGMEVKQEYYSILRNGYALSFILSYSDDVDAYQELRNSLEALTFN